ncbi:flavin reductase like domain-containing protein [Elsinoe ampelina]|uniref:Flavin reductase like domain-containing protein n=1 Tax=Elsinoe ampelina TaxID=302913 RepID=A0A6A6G2W9_9PEZI|nr:flavin reductase like domain-containing protein [Elsinoe ampelina]
MLDLPGGGRASTRFFCALFEYSLLSHTSLPRQTCHARTLSRHLSSTTRRNARSNLTARTLPDNGSSVDTNQNPKAGSQPTTTAKVSLSTDQLQQLKDHQTLKELQVLTGCDIELGSPCDSGTVLYLSGSAGDVRVAMQSLSRSLGADGVAEKRHTTRVADGDRPDGNADAPSVEVTRKATAGLRSGSLLHDHVAGLNNWSTGSHQAALKDYKVVEVTTTVDVPREIAMLFPMEEAAISSAAGLISRKSAQAPRSVTRLVVNGRPPMLPLRITGDPKQVENMVNRIQKLQIGGTWKSLGPKTTNVELQDSTVEASFRHVMRSVVNPVAVLTTRLPNEASTSEERFLGCRGSTVSSLASVAVRPAPVVSFNLLADSRTAQKIDQVGYCDVHLLGANAAGVQIAKPFAAHKGMSLLEPFRKVDSLEHTRIDIDPEGAVYIDSPGVLAHLRCRLIQGKSVKIGDHKVMFCEVVKLSRRTTDANEPWQEVTEPLQRTSLAYANQAYGVLRSPSYLKPGRSVKEEDAASAKPTNQRQVSETTKEAPEQRHSYDHIKAQTDALLDQCLSEEEARAFTDEPASSSHSSRPAPPTTGSPLSKSPYLTRPFSTITLPSLRRLYSTCPPPSSSSSSSSSSSPSSSSSSSSPLFSPSHPTLPSPPTSPRRIPPTSPLFLRQTLTSFLAYDSYPKGRWVNDRWIRELQDYGPDRVQMAIRGGQTHAPDDGQPGGKRNSKDLRIRKLIELLHRAQKRGHLKEGVMEELVLGKGARGLDGKA